MTETRVADISPHPAVHPAAPLSALILSRVGCFAGLNLRGGMQGVGRRTTQAVVILWVMIIGADTFFTKLAPYPADRIF